MVVVSPTTLAFTDGANKVAFTLSSPTPIVYKVMTNKPDVFTVKPRFAVLVGGETALHACLVNKDAKVRAKIVVKNITEGDAAAFGAADEAGRKAIWDRASQNTEQELPVTTEAAARASSVHPVLQTLLTYLPEQLPTLLCLQISGGAWLMGVLFGWYLFSGSGTPPTAAEDAQA